MLKNKNGNGVLDRMDSQEIIDYIMENMYGEVRDIIMENEIPDGE